MLRLNSHRLSVPCNQTVRH